MAESEIVTKEDIAEFSSVLQLAPHQKNTQFTSVTKSEDGDLVSLDELYEKTGQEAINTFVNGFNMVIKSNKLGRVHAEALNIKGAEGWMVVPDKINAIRGQEGFFSAVRDGIVTIVKAIIAFITGVCNWISVRVKALIGWGPTIKETHYLYDNSDKLKAAATMFFKNIGIIGFDPEEYFESLPDNITLNQAFTITKKRIDDNKVAFEKLEAAAEYLKDYEDVFNGWTSNIRGSKRDYERLINNIRNKVRSKNVTIGDIQDLNIGLAELTARYSDPKNILEYLKGLTKVLYDIELKGLGMENNFNKLKSEIESLTEKVKVTDKTEYRKLIRTATLSIYKNLYAGAGTGNKKLDTKTINELKNTVNDKDAVLIQELSAKFPELQLSATYVSFGNSVSGFSSAIDMTLELIQKANVSINNMVRWNTDFNNLAIAYMTDDLVTVLAANAEYLTPTERASVEKIKVSKKLDGSGKKVETRIPLYMDTLQDAFLNDSSVNGEKRMEKASSLAKELFETPQGQSLLKNLERFRNQLRG